MVKFANRVKDVESSVTLAITSRAKAMQKEGRDVVNLAAGEPAFDTPDAAKEAGIRAIRDGFTKYTPEGGTFSLREAVCEKLKRDNGLSYAPDEIIVSNGAKHSLYNIFQVICDAGDEVIIIHPYWLSYPEMVRLAGGVPRIVQTGKKDNFKARIEDIKKAVTKRTKAVVINSPSNPAGVVYDEKELAEFASFCLGKNLLIISDEIYEKIIFDGLKHVSIASLSKEARKNTIVVNGVSKSYSMTGWRIGYLAADKEIVRRVSALQGHSTSNPCSISQAAAEEALRSGLGGFIEKNRLDFQRKRDILMDLLSCEGKIRPIRPSGAFYLFCDISASGISSVNFSRKLLEEKEVAVIPGEPFGDDNCVRISFAAGEETLRKGIERVRDWLKTL